MEPQVHKPVLLKEVLFYLEPSREQSLLDVTAGYGGHTRAILALTGEPSKAVLVDRDAEAIKALYANFAQVKILHQDFLSASRDLCTQGQHFDLILADLGVSTAHLKTAERGFSFSTDGPLDMRMDQSQKLSAETLVNRASAKELEDILSKYGQEPKAREITRRIIARRVIKTTTELAKIVSGAYRGRSKIHPATRTFQALRIAVNDELAQLEQSLPLWLKLLAPGGRIVVISFHSLEDRLVKKFLAEHSQGYDAQLKLLTKKPVTANDAEIVSNPRARSAKLRAAAKIKNRKG